MLRKLTGLGSVVLTLSLLDVACTSAKDDPAADGGTHGNGVGDSSTSDKDATRGSGGSAGSTASATGGSRTSTGGTTHSGGAAGASSGNSGTGRDAGTGHDSGTHGNSDASADSGVNGDSGAGGTSGAPHDSGTGGDNANNVLIDPGFEEVTLEPWLSDGPDLVLEQVDPHSGNQHAALENAYTDPSPLDERMTQGANLLPPGTYTFRIWIKKAGSGNLTALRVIAEGFNYMDPSEGTELDILQDVTDTYQLFTLTGISVTTAGPDVGSCTVAVAASGDENAKVYLDDASLTKDP
jgi:hypothetical protein